jgi:hypothetical protein
VVFPRCLNRANHKRILDRELVAHAAARLHLIASLYAAEAWIRVVVLTLLVLLLAARRAPDGRDFKSLVLFSTIFATHSAQLMALGTAS